MAAAIHDLQLPELQETAGIEPAQHFLEVPVHGETWACRRHEDRCDSGRSGQL
jgi:hypothetical protein